MNTEERQLADVLHRITPEPPRRVTVEQVAYRLVSEPRLGRGSRRGREPRPRRGGLGLSRAWAPVMAAAAVVVIAGASAGVAVLASSHHNSPSPSGGAPASSSVSSAPVSSSPPDVIPGPADHAGDGHRGRALGRGADRPPDVHPGLAGQRRRLAVRVRDRHPGPDRPGHRDRRGDRTVQPAAAEPAGHRREHGVGGVVQQRRQRGPARLQRPDARPDLVGAGARHRPGVPARPRTC